MHLVLGECPAKADEETVRRFACAYIMMLLGTQLFADKSGNRIHIRWLPYVARLEEMGGYSWGSVALAWLYRFRPAGYDTCSWPLASRWSGYNFFSSEKGPRVQMCRLRIDMLQARDVVHPEVLEHRHTALWRSVTSLIYFAVIEWHQIDRVLPQFGGVQPRPQPALNIDFLMSKDGIGDPGPSHDFLEWWIQHGKRFLSPEMYLGDLRAVPIPVEATQRGAGRVPDMDRVDDAMDDGNADGRRGGHGGRRRARAADHDHNDHGDDDDDQHGPVGGTLEGMLELVGVSPHHGGHGGEWYGSGMGDGADQGDGGLGSGPLGDYFVSVHAHDQTLQESTPWVSPTTMFSDLLAGDGLDANFGGSHFLDEISAIMQEDDAAGRRGQTSGTQAPLDVDLNEPPTMPAPDSFALGGTPPSAYTDASHSVAGPSGEPVQPRPPEKPAPDEEEDEIKDEELLIRRGHRTRVPRRCFTGSHLFR
ncbi:hypothetical protein Ahy_B08g093527 [Arachis hypogaea]|uniref:Aminotransferase-like plant mobile domain-containing protein n=2 Tax=Arachis TaxID=3817 RepID=A0A444Y6C2_ARAHY|nr:hypothetical protein Ahy_B08g093527 [Arachis hypogaea]